MAAISLTCPVTVGRFAPSPTGHLHLGSLVTAVASYCIAKQPSHKRQGGLWRLRIDDLDTQRCRPEYSDSILHDLTRLGLHWDGEVRYQSAHLNDYHEAIAQLKGLSYGCDCSRKSIAHHNQTHGLPPNHYSQRCYGRSLPHTHAMRVLMPDQQTVFFDQLQGTVCGNPQQQHGDFVIRRRATSPDHLGMINYMLAVVIDDAAQGVNQVVRGMDILPLTVPQLVMADYLQLPMIAEYHHLPILVNTDGQKLSKQTLAQPIRQYPATPLLSLALTLLNQPPVITDTPERMLTQAVAQWDSTPLIRQTQIVCQDLDSLIKSMA